MACKPRVTHKALSLAAVLTGGTITFAGVNIFQGNERFYRQHLMPTIHRFVDPEMAHVLAVKMAKYSLVPRENVKMTSDAGMLHTKVLGLTFDNPIGLAAGFDKNGEAVNGLSKMGFGFVEVGSVTPEPQDGNPRPRVFRLLEEKGIINRYGFNSIGHDRVKENLKAVNKNLSKTMTSFWTPTHASSSSFDHLPVILGVNLGKNKSSPQESLEDFTLGLKSFSDQPMVDYFVINVSSPNTPGLRSLHGRDHLKNLLDSLSSLKKSGNLTKPILLKISPDTSFQERKDIADLIVKNKTVCSGIIVSNTTTSRPESIESNEVGGLSGAPLKSLSTQAVHDMYKLTKGEVPIIGVGGVFTGEDAFEKISAGASLVQIYTSLTFEGPPVVSAIKRDLTKILKEKGFHSVTEAVGCDHHSS